MGRKIGRTDNRNDAGHLSPEDWSNFPLFNIFSFLTARGLIVSPSISEKVAMLIVLTTSDSVS